MRYVLLLAGICAVFQLAVLPCLAAEPGWETSIYPEEQIFPSYLISTATQGPPESGDDLWDTPNIGDANGLVGALFHNLRKGDRVRVTVKANALMDESSFDGVTPKTTGDLLVHPKVKYRYDALAKIRQQQPLNVSIETWVNDKSLGEKTATVAVHSINDCLYAVVDDKGRVEFDATWNFAAYVNEDHPWVDRILKEALESKIVDAFDGYQSGKSEDVLLQIYAIWYVMQHRGMHYSNIATNASESDTVLSQHVRLFDESVKAHQANCVDGSVLLAAVLRKIGLNTYLVIEPEHMFVAVDLKEDDDDSTIGIETTMMGDENATDFKPLKKISKDIRQKWKDEPSFRTFEAAVDSGTSEIDDHEKEFNDEKNPDYQFVDITEARSEGIMPIGFSSDR